MTPLAKKLHLKPGMTICVLDAPAAYQAALGALPEGVIQVKAPRGELDLLQIFVTKKEQLNKKLASLKGAMDEKTALWVCYPKAKGLRTDLNRDILSAWLGENGLTSVAQIAIDDVWSGLRFKLAAVPKTPKRAAARRAGALPMGAQHAEERACTVL